MKTWTHFFASGPNFLDPPTCKDGRPYGPERYKEIVQECWYISDHLHTSYTDILDISVMERRFLIDNIKYKIDETKKAVDAATAEAKARRGK